MWYKFKAQIGSGMEKYKVNKTLGKHHGKVLALLLIILLAITLVVGYLYLNEKIIVGEKQIAYGQREIEKGQLALDKGKAKLEIGNESCQRARRSTSKLKTTASWC